MWCSYLDIEQFTQLAVTERMLLAFAECSSWLYASTDGAVRFPRYRDHLPSSRCLTDNPTACQSTHKTNCSSLTSYLLFTVYPNDWTAQDYKDLQIMDAARPWSPIDCVAAKPFGEQVSKPVPGHWHLCQKWKSLSPLSGGHARLVRCLDDGDTLLAIEATNRGGLGVTTSVLTWSDLVSANQEARLAVLR